MGSFRGTTFVPPPGIGWRQRFRRDNGRSRMRLGCGFGASTPERRSAGAAARAFSLWPFVSWQTLARLLLSIGVFGLMRLGRSLTHAPGDCQRRKREGAKHAFQETTETKTVCSN